LAVGIHVDGKHTAGFECLRVQGIRFPQGSLGNASVAGATKAL